MKLNVYEIIE